MFDWASQFKGKQKYKNDTINNNNNINKTPFNIMCVENQSAIVPVIG